MTRCKAFLGKSRHDAVRLSHTRCSMLSSVTPWWNSMKKAHSDGSLLCIRIRSDSDQIIKMLGLLRNSPPVSRQACTSVSTGIGYCINVSISLSVDDSFMRQSSSVFWCATSKQRLSSLQQYCCQNGCTCVSLHGKSTEAHSAMANVGLKARLNPFESCIRYATAHLWRLFQQLQVSCTSWKT